MYHVRVQDLCEQGGGPGLSFPVPFFPPSLISHEVSVDIKHDLKKKELRSCVNREVDLSSCSLSHSSHGP